MDNAIVRDVTAEDLERETLHVPGDGPRILLCVHGTLHFEGCDQARIVAMAETPAELLEAVRAEGVRYEDVPMIGVCFRTEAVYEAGASNQGYLAVVDAPIADIRSLDLGSFESLKESVAALVARASAPSSR
jgi:hypothetical protein